MAALKVTGELLKNSFVSSEIGDNMKRKGTIAWFVYACILCMGFSRTTAFLTKMLGMSVSAYFALTAALVSAVLLLIYLPVKLLAGKFALGAEEYRKECGNETASEIFETAKRISSTGWMLLVLLLGALVNIRIFLAPAGSGASSAVPLERACTFSGPSGFSVGELYTGLLALLLQFLFETDAVFLCNLVFQVLGAFFLYIGIHMLAGTVCAVSALIFVIYLPVFHNSVYMAEPQSMLLFFYGLLLWACACCLRRIARGAAKGGVCVPTLLAGLSVGIASFINTQLCGLLFLTGAGVGGMSKKSRKPAAISFAGAALIGFCALFAMAFLGSGEGTVPERLQSVFFGWLMSGSVRDYDALLHSPTLADYWMTVPPYLLAFLALLGASDPKGQNGRPWIWPLALTVIAETLGEAPLQEQGIRFVLLGVMAGYGLRRMFLAERKAPELSEEENVIKINDVRTVQESFENEELEEQVERMMENAFKSKTEQRIASPKKPGEFLDNPLPVPKRHVKKEMGYAFEPEADQMFYDIPVSDQDDFDI